MRRIAAAAIAAVMVVGLCAVASGSAQAQTSSMPSDDFPVDGYDQDFCLSGWQTTIVFALDRSYISVDERCEDLDGYGFGVVASRLH
ncbi:MAG TPA: hypothetical protein VMG55_06420 [Stellaceae bacterium]|nr:hypothetical protein [Stellaceae bacterium]